MNVAAWIDTFSHRNTEKEKPVIEFLGRQNIEINEIEVDSKKVSPGTLFVALKGNTEDGHHYINESIQRGATAILLEEPVPESLKMQQHSTTFIRVDDTKEALRHLVPYFFNYPANGLHLIGITGTNGKTTTAFLINQLLNQADIKTGLLSTITYRLGGHETVPKNTTPGLLELHQYFSAMQKNGVTHVVMEVSSHALHQGRVADCQFETTVFTNLTQDHLDYHHTMTAYFEAKKILFHQTKGKWVVNIDDEHGRILRQDVPERCWGYGIDQKEDLYPIRFKSTLNGIWMIAKTPIGKIEMTSPLVGRHNIYNILAAIGAAISLGLSKNEIASGIPALKHVPGRFEKIDAGQDFTVIVDYAHTPDALERLLQTVSTLEPTRVITVFGCGGDRDRGKRPQMGRAASAYSHKIILTSDNPRNEQPLDIIGEIEAGIREHNKRGETSPADYEIIPDRQEAIYRAIQLAKTGEMVIIAGKGHERVQQIGEDKFPFDDREKAREALAERG